MSEGVCCSRRRVLAQQHQAGKMFIISEFPGQEAANSPGFPVYTITSQTAQFWPGFIFVSSFAQEGSFFFFLYISLDFVTHRLDCMFTHEGPSHKSQGFNGRTPVAKQRLRRAKQMPAECNGM